MRKIELLVPASSLEVLKIAVVFGADAVYIGGEAFGLRAKAKNFSKEDMAEGIAFAHEHGVKVYVTVNILAHNDDLPVRPPRRMMISPGSEFSRMTARLGAAPITAPISIRFAT